MSVFTVSAVRIYRKSMYCQQKTKAKAKNSMGFVAAKINADTQNVGVLLILLFVCVHVFT